MALHFGKAHMKLGHPVTIFLNDKAVILASKPSIDYYSDQQKDLAELVNSGATLMVCHHCADYYGVTETDLLTGAKYGTPELIAKQLFSDGTKTLSW